MRAVICSCTIARLLRQRRTPGAAGGGGPGRPRQDDGVPDLDDSELVPSLIEAAERGKQAVCLVELKARFDERRNIGWARALEEAGAHVVHGLPGLKTHAKALLVVRREGRGVRHYVHIGTENYHAKTARLYEDYGLFTWTARSPPMWQSSSTPSQEPPLARLSQDRRGTGPHADLAARPGRTDDRHRTGEEALSS